MTLSTTRVSLVLSGSFDYFKFIKATLSSFKRWHPDSDCYVFIFDTFDVSALDFEEIKDVVFFGINDIGDQRAGLLDSANYFNVFEMAMVSKYIALRHVASIASSSQYLIYADSDIWFESCIDPFLKPFEDDVCGVFSSHSLSLGSGEQVFDLMCFHGVNAGFFALNKNNEQAQPFLDFMTKTIFDLGLWELPFLTCDQSILSIAITKLGERARMSSLEAVNLAYWNITERHLQIKNGKPFVNDLPVICIHFSGFDLNSERLSKHGHIEPSDATNHILQVYKSGIDCSINYHHKNLKNALLIKNRNFIFRIWKIYKIRKSLSFDQMSSVVLQYIMLKVFQKPILKALRLFRSF